MHITKTLRTPILLAVLLAVLTATASCRTTSYITPSDIASVGEVSYTDDEDLILQKIAQLGSFKAARNTACVDVDALRDELTSLGAFPSEDKLAEFKLDAPVKFGGETISALSDFARVLGGAYDVFTIEKTYGSDGKTYNVCEVIIQADVDTSLMMKLVQGGRLGIDFFSESKAESVPYSADNGKAADIEATTAQGKTRSYSVVAFSLPTVSLLYVKGDGGEWRHTMTSSYANVCEDHFVIYTDDKDEYTTAHESYDSVKHPEAYEDRLAYAVEAYKLGGGLCRDMVVGYDVTPRLVELAELADRSVELEVASPVDLPEMIACATDANSVGE